MSVIRCHVDLFAYEQTIYEQNNNNIKIIAKIPMTNLANFIARYVSENDINEIHLVGYEDFTVDIKNQIIETSKTKYRNNKPLNIVLERKDK